MPRVRGWAAVASLITLSIAMPGPFAVAAAPAPESANLTLEPSSTLPGQDVTAAGTGFPGGDPVEFVAPAECSLAWDGAPIDSDCTVDESGALKARFTVPADAPPGRHRVTATADDAVATAGLRVLLAVFVPDLQGLPSGAARDALSAARLSDCESAQGSGVVVRQVPVPGVTVAEGTCVRVRLRVQQSTVTLVTVPDLRGMTIRQAENALQPLPLVLAPPAAADSGDRVADQSPAPGAQVRPESPVIVDVEATGVEDTAVPPESGQPATPGMLAALGMAAALGIVAGAAITRSRRKGPRSGSAHLEARPDHTFDVEVFGPSSPRAPRVRLDPHPDTDVQPDLRKVST